MEFSISDYAPESDFIIKTMFHHKVYSLLYIVQRAVIRHENYRTQMVTNSSFEHPIFNLYIFTDTDFQINDILSDSSDVQR